MLRVFDRCDGKNTYSFQMRPQGPQPQQIAVENRIQTKRAGYYRRRSLLQSLSIDMSMSTLACSGFIFLFLISIYLYFVSYKKVLFFCYSFYYLYLFSLLYYRKIVFTFYNIYLKSNRIHSMKFAYVLPFLFLLYINP
jgi:hypothetical protein